MKIALISPDYFPIPPVKYGGIERVVYTLTETLVDKGHEVVLYAPRGSRTRAKLIPYLHEGQDMSRIPGFVKLTLPKGTDIIHDHTQLSVVGRSMLPVPTVSTIHNPLHNPVEHPVYISRRHMELFGQNHGTYVYNGLNPNEYEFTDQKSDYLLYIGAIIGYKGVHHAIEVAERTNQKLIIAGPVYDGPYYQQEILSKMMANPRSHIQYIGEVGGQTRLHLYKNAKCVLFPTLCEEPFGLVMIEAMVSGTPVLGLANGSVPEVLGRFPELLCHSVEDMVEKARSAAFPSPMELREHVMSNFTASLMADRYLEIYKEVTGKTS
ncbi:glycosyltransferase family 4 protein [Paenibacillus sp. y28]|uniref:glycosyltransferase family 4 protein n=1 Tax=Paenibacillus sp. y28 TaxID=3129110 RepID=UPI0030196A18